MSEKLFEHQRSLLLLDLLLAPNRTLARGEANKKLTPARKRDLDLITSAANAIRDQLAAEGFINRRSEKRSVRFQLTDKGLAMLAAHEQYPPLNIRLKGRELNALLAAVREPSVDWPPPVQPSPSERSQDDRAPDIFGIFQELQHERAGYSRLVPIHEIRRRVAEKYGANAAAHDVFDQQVKQLWREGKLRMVSISDPRDATPEQLMDSIPGINETLFYVEALHEPVALR
jgi:hypothetical protein